MSASVEPLTVAQGWDKYAQNYEGEEVNHLGDEWNAPEVMGLDVPADQIISYLDERVFTPFLGTCEVLLEIGPGGGRFTEVQETYSGRNISNNAEIASRALYALHKDRVFVPRRSRIIPN